jgi:hypothetical protein
MISCVRADSDTRCPKDHEQSAGSPSPSWHRPLFHHCEGEFSTEASSLDQQQDGIEELVQITVFFEQSNICPDTRTNIENNSLRSSLRLCELTDLLLTEVDTSKHFDRQILQSKTDSF